MADVKLLASQRLTDNPDGGGLMTSIEIVSGVVNNVWPDISRVDRAYGVVNLRKLYVKADTPDTAIYAGLHVIYITSPQDPRVTVTMFTTNSWTDERADAQSAMERYLDESVVTRMIPFDRQLKDQRTILVFQRPELDLPEIGTVYVLTALPAETTVQFVRVSDLSHSVQTFTDPSTGQDFPARVITLTLTEPLTTTFQGSQPTKFFTAQTNTSQIRKTIVSDAVNYHTVHTLAADAAIGDVTVKLGSVYAQLVPASTAEVPVLDAPPGQTVAIVPSGPDTTVFTIGTNLLSVKGAVNYLPTAAVPGSVTIAEGGTPIIYDDGAGLLHFGSVTGTAYWSIDYEHGLITTITAWPGTGGSSTVGTATYTPAAAVSMVSQTFQLPVSQSTRGYVYTATLHPIPAPGNLSIAFRALGRWYTLTDDGSGALVGEIGIGTGTINFATGSLAVTLGALPDIGSSIIMSWGSDSQFEIKTADLTIGNPTVTATLPEGNCKPSTMTVTWTANAVTKTATDNGSGSFTGDATGHIVYGNGSLALKPTVLPDPTTTFHFEYQKSDIRTETFNPSKSGSTITMTVAHAPIRPRSLLIRYPQTFNVNGLSITTEQVLTDDGSGNLVDAAGDLKSSSLVNYTTGAITFNPDFTMIQPVLDYSAFDNQLPGRLVDPGSGYFAAAAQFGKWPVSCSSASGGVSFVNGSAVFVQYKEDSATDVDSTYDVAAPPLTIDLTPTVVNTVVQGGVMFTLGGRQYVDRAGSLYYGLSKTTNAGTLGGGIDYGTGKITLTSWVGAGSPTLSLQALLTQVRALPITVITGRVPGQTLRPASFYLQANLLDGTLISATADTNGNISTANMHGYVDVTTGVYSVAFGQYVLDSSLTTDEKLEPWYDSGAVVGGYVFKPAPVAPNSITYNAVIQTSLPLDSTILGIDPVRLPLDGRVQAVRPGYMLIVFDTAVTTLPGGLVADQVVTLPRDLLALVEVRDQDGLLVPGQTSTEDPVPGALYTADLAAGTITMAHTLDLSGFTQPLVATHRIEDASVVTDVLITGHVTVAEPLTHAYTADNSQAATALIAPFVGGSVQGAYTDLFTQQTWNNSAPNWTDAVIGSGTTANVDDLDFPIQVLNRDAITQRWAFVFTSATAFNIVAQDLGVIGTGTTSTDVFPINPGVDGAVTATTGTFSIAAVGSTQDIPVTSVTSVEVGAFCTITEASHAITALITNIVGTTVTAKTMKITTGAAGNTMAAAAVFAIVHPYFFFDHRAFGSGWASGNAIRFNTQGAGFSIWQARTVRSGPASYMDDFAVIEPRWDKS